MSRKVINTVIKKSNIDEFTIVANLSREMFSAIVDSEQTITNEEALTILGVDFNMLNNILLDNRKSKLYLELSVKDDNNFSAFYSSPLGITFVENQLVTLVSLNVFDAQYLFVLFSSENVVISLS